MDTDKIGWVDKYEPQSLDEMILTRDKREQLQKIIDNISNVVLYGNPGTGKSTFMKILLNEADPSAFKINASFDNGIDTIRLKVSKFARALSSKKIKIVYFEESDQLTQEAQDALKDLIDTTKQMTRYFFLTNDIDKLSDPIQSRCMYKLHFEDPPIKLIQKHVMRILEKEKVLVKDQADVNHFVNQYYPDIRQIINALQSNVINNELKLILSKKKKPKKLLKTADSMRETGRIRGQRFLEKQKQTGKKQISCFISIEAYEILKKLPGTNNEIIDRLILQSIRNA